MPEIGEIILKIDCYQCGTKLELHLKLFKNRYDRSYCPYCQEGVSAYFTDRVLEIERLNQE